MTAPTAAGGALALRAGPFEGRAPGRPLYGGATTAVVAVVLALIFARVSAIVEETLLWPSFIIPLCGGLLVAVLGLRLVDGRHPVETFGPATVLVSSFIVLFLAVRLPGLIFAGDRESLVEATVFLVKDAFIAIALVFAAERSGGLRAGLWGMVLAGATLSALTLHKVVTGAVDDPYAGFSRATGALVSATENGIRYTGPFDDPNFYAQILTVAIAFAVVRYWHTRSFLERATMLAALALCVTAIGFTLSRGGLVAAGVVIIASIVLRFGRWALVTVVFVGAVVTGLLPGSVVARVTSVAEAPGALVGGDADDPSIQGRTSETLVGVAMFADHPLLGVGYANYEANYLRYSSGIGLDPRRTERAAHNLFLEAAAELGIVGLTGFGAFVGAAVVVPGRVRRRRRALGDLDGAATAEALQLAVIGYLITAVFLHDAFTRIFVVLMALAIGSVMLDGGADDAEQADPEPERPARRLRVVQVIDSLTTGGAERLVAEFGARVDRLDLDAEVVSLAPATPTPVTRDLDASGVVVTHLPSRVKRGLFDRTRERALRRLLTAADPDVVHLHLETATIIGGRVAAKLGIPTVVTLHNTEPSLGRGRWVKERWLRRRLRRVDKVIAVGATVAEAWKPRLDGVGIAVVPNPARTLRTARRRPAGAATTSALADPTGGQPERDRLTLISVGRLTKQKGVPDLLDAMVTVVRAHPTARLLLVGDGPDRAAIEAKVADLGLGGSVQLLGVRSDVDRLLAASDLFVLASHWEGLPLALLEAMAAGLPVVATDVGDVADVVGPSAGTVVPPGSVDRLATALVTQLADPNGRRAAGEAARQRIEQNHDPDRWADRLNELYADLGTTSSRIRTRRFV